MKNNEDYFERVRIYFLMYFSLDIFNINYLNSGRTFTTTTSILTDRWAELTRTIYYHLKTAPELEAKNVVTKLEKC